MSYKWAEEQFWNATTDTVFTWLEFDLVEHTVNRSLRLNLPLKPRGKGMKR